MQAQEKIKTKAAFKRLMAYVNEYRAGFITAVLGMIGYAAVDTYFLSTIKPFIDNGLGQADPDIFKYAPFFVVGIFIVRGICNFAATYCLAWVGNKVVAKMRQQMFEHLLRLPVSFHDQQSTGDLISKITYDTEQVSNAASKALLVLIREGAYVAGLLFLMFYHSWQLSLIFLFIGPIIGLIATNVSRRFRKASAGIQTAMGDVTTTSEQMINGHRVVLMFGGQEKETQRFQRINNNNRQQQMKMVLAKAVSVPFIQIIASFALAGVLYVASFDSILETLTPGTFTVIVTSMVMLLRPLKQLTNVNADFQRGMAACVSIFDILDLPQEPDNGTHKAERVNGHIQVKDLTFSYEGQSRPALKNVNFNLAAGKTLALVGRSGSGKSTISNLLTRFYQPQQGEILLDGKSIQDFNLDSLREQFALVSQHVTLFNDTVANNIAYGAKHATPERIMQAAEAAHVVEFLDKLPLGLDTEIGENGVMLSGGQRQRIAIARAILCDAPILILDEATSALDTESERAIQDALNELQKGRTCIVIAHRLSTIENADEILVVDNGEVIEQGNHQTLLQNKGMYAQLHSMQFGA